jgi:hypothetical protein
VGILGVDLILPLACEPPTARNLDRLPLTANDVDGCDQPRLPSAVRALRAANIIGVLGLLAGTISRDLVRPAGREGSSQPTLNPQRALHLGRDPSLDSPIPRTSALHVGFLGSAGFHGMVFNMFFLLVEAVELHEQRRCHARAWFAIRIKADITRPYRFNVHRRLA